MSLQERQSVAREIDMPYKTIGISKEGKKDKGFKGKMKRVT
jgi:hypothetical protein